MIDKSPLLMQRGNVWSINKQKITVLPASNGAYLRLNKITRLLLAVKATDGVAPRVQLPFSILHSKNWGVKMTPVGVNRGPQPLGGISSSVMSVFFTDKFALSQSDARISVAYKIC